MKDDCVDVVRRLSEVMEKECDDVACTRTINEMRRKDTVGIGILGREVIQRRVPPKNKQQTQQPFHFETNLSRLFDHMVLGALYG